MSDHIVAAHASTSSRPRGIWLLRRPHEVRASYVAEVLDAAVDP